MDEPTWAKVHYPKIDFQDLYYYAAPKGSAAPKSLDEVDPKLLETYAKLGIPLKEQEILAGVRKQGEKSELDEEGSEYASGKVAVDAVFDSVSVVTTFKAELAKAGRDLLLDLGSAARAPGAGEEVPVLRRAAGRQLSMPRSTRRCSPTAPSSMCRRACAARWSSRPISA